MSFVAWCVVVGVAWLLAGLGVAQLLGRWVDAGRATPRGCDPESARMWAELRANKTLDGKM